jgi:hypothetical protein
MLAPASNPNNLLFMATSPIHTGPLRSARWLPQTTCADYARSSGDLLPPSPPAEKATASQAFASVFKKIGYGTPLLVGML